MSGTAATICKVSAAAVKMLRTADAMSIHHVAGRSFIQIYMTPGMKDRVEIEVGHEFTDFPGDFESEGMADRLECYSGLYGYKHDDEPMFWTLRAIRPGDFLTIHWLRECYRGPGGGMTIEDQAQLIVRRPVKGHDTVKRVGVFHLVNCICAADSMARMIRPAR